MYKEINLPQSIKLSTQSNRKVVRVGSVENIVSFKSMIDKTIEFYAQNTHELYLYLSDFSALRELNNLRYRNLNIIFDVNEKNIKLLKEFKDFLPKFRFKAVLDTTVKPDEISSVVKFLSFLGVKSEITYDLFKTIDEKQMKQITDEIVLNTQILKDVEPFFSFTHYIYTKKMKKEIKHTLWDVFKDNIERFSYITNDGYVTISKRWDKRSRYLFNLDEGKEKEMDSELYKELNSYEQNLFFKNLECAMCGSYEFCGAYLKLEDGNYNCTPFQTMLKDIEDNFDIFQVRDSKAA